MENKDKLILFVITCIVVVGIYFSTAGFWAGFHNTDLSYNALRLSYEYGDMNYSELFDTLNGEPISMVGLYSFGIEGMKKGFMMSLFLNVLFIIYIVYQFVNRN